MGLRHFISVLGGICATAAAAAPPDYQMDIVPVLAEHCILCHGPDKQKSGLRLDSYAAIQQGGESGAPIVPSDPDASLLFQAISGTHEELKMPPEGDPLSAEQIALIREWIAAGAPGPAVVEGAAARSDHWAFQPVNAPEPPTVQAEGWAANPVDRFVLRALEEQGIAPAQQADRITLLRRLHLDLTGLPPTPAEVDAYLADASPDAYQQAVDRLLASPHFGERWARHWLDLARYADSDGYEKDTARPWAWRYRDWVINAINADLPYDQFVIEQIAGDLLPDAAIEQKAATGFHRNTLTNKEGGVDPEEFRVAQVVDRTNTTLQALMGVTMNCAACHTHKYDPITHAEYYQMYAFFNNADEVDIRAPLPPEQEAYDRAMAEYEAGLARLEAERDARLDALAPGQAEWEAGLDTAPIEWRALEPQSFKAASGAQLKKLGDGSILVQGGEADKDTYTIELETDMAHITAFQLEALLDGSLPETGPGRAPNGNFVLTEFKIGALPENRPRVVNLAAFGKPSSPDELNDDGGSGGDSAAVDGDANTFWDEENGKEEYRFALEFRSPKRAGSIAITGYQHHDHAPKDFKVLLDGEMALEITGAEYENNFFIAEFRKQRCKTLELVITGYYGQSPAIRELGVYEESAGRVKHSLQGPDPVKVESVIANVEQGGFPSVNSADTDNATGWAPDAARARGNSDARFVLAQTLPGGKTKYTFTIDQQYGGKHTLGRFRISATSDAPEKVRLSEAARLALNIPPDLRGEAEKREALIAFGQFDPETKSLYEAITKHKSSVPKAPETMAQTLAERQEKRETHIHIRGDFLQPGDRVEPGVPAVFHPLEPRGDSPDRLDLAHWLVDKRNPLTARVQVNRVWARLFGQGLVRTPEDWGTRGERPTHPELLDWLAHTYMHDLAWSTKGLIRLIVNSSAYRQSSVVRPELEDRDPDNRLIARQGRFRVEAEVVRDLFLASSGLLNTGQIGGPSMRPDLPESFANLGYADSVKYPASPEEDQRRRGLYIQFQRTIALPMLMTFDCPDSNVTALKRERSNTPLQALTLLNDPLFVECAQGLGNRVVAELADAPPRERLRHAFRLCMSREPTARELDRLEQAFHEHTTFYGDRQEEAAKIAGIMEAPLPPQEGAAYVALARAILNLGEFITRE